MRRWVRPVSDEELVAFAEGRLGRRARRRVSAHLREHPADADRVRAYLGQDARLRQLYDPVLEEPLPARLRRLVEAPAPAPRPRGALVPALVLSSLVLAGLALAVGVWEGLPGRGARPSAERASAVGPAPVAAQLQDVPELAPQAGPVPATPDPAVDPGPHDL